MFLKHDSRDPFYRNPIGAAPTRGAIRLRFSIKHEAMPDFVRIRTFSITELWYDMAFVGNLDGEFIYEATVLMPDKPTWFWYDFRVCINDCELSYGNAADKLFGEGQVWDNLPPSYQITVYDSGFKTPDWMKRAIVYQIFPDRFNRAGPITLTRGRALHENWNDKPAISNNAKNQFYSANDFFGGTLAGITEKLPYLAALGINAIYLNPIFAANTNHRYDTNDYHLIDPMLGTLDDFKKLCSSAKKAGIRLILDGVFSHIGLGSKYFVSAKSGKDSPYYSWFKFDSSKIGYSCWWGDPLLPETNEMNPDFLSYTLTGDDATVPYWINKGASGWRLDVADELPMPFLRILRDSAKSADPDACVIGEVWENASRKTTYGETRGYCFGDTLDSVMNYPLRATIISFLTGAQDAERARREILSLFESYPTEFAYSLMNLMGSHDRARVINLLAGITGDGLSRAEQRDLIVPEKLKRLAISRLKLFYSLLAALPGMPTIYYGDEAYMEGAHDPFNRGTYPWGREDDELISFFTETNKQRAKNHVLSAGELSILSPTRDTLLVKRSISGGLDALNRRAKDALSITIVNRNSSSAHIALMERELCGKTLYAANDASALEPEDGLYKINLQGLAAISYFTKS